ncbi:MAG TPA: hypothetical protein VGS20_01330 [Candidatus Acidoferrales bacterium]|nr:hypothetical protein [Candidatus Acidoferrales bacterium]
MAEEPIRLFPTRAESYPEPDGADTMQGIARAGLAAIPVFGGSVTEILSLVLAPAVQLRRDEWFRELADAVDRLEKRLDGFKIENLVQDDAFVSATIQATRIAVATHQREKREMLRNALLNIATGKGPREELQQVYLNAVGDFTASHVKVLQFLWKGNTALRPPITNYGQAIEQAHPELRGQGDFVQHIMNDLRNRGFSHLSGPSAAHPQHPAITNLGIEFLTFLSAPETQEPGAP